jgi:beta-lactam-binding protein with PASTA domain
MRAAASWFAGVASIALMSGAAWAQRAVSDVAPARGRPVVTEAARPSATAVARPAVSETTESAVTAAPRAPIARFGPVIVQRPPESKAQVQPQPGAGPESKPDPSPTKPRTIAMPDLLGRTCEQAREVLQRFRTRLGECPVGTRRGGYVAGTINWQSIAAGSAVPINVGAPPLAGLRVELQPAAQREPTTTPPTTDTRPATGSEPARPDPLVRRPDPIPPRSPRTLPDLVGLTCAQADRTLAPLGVKGTRCDVGAALAGARAGRINAQSRPPGAVLPLRSPLVLNVQPADAVAVPGLVGQTEAQALGVLSALRLRGSASGPAAALGRRVVSQSPPEGTRVMPGATVGMRLGLTVPALRGLGCTAARDAAARHGHADLQCDTRPADSPARALDQVFEQRPESNLPPQPGPVAIRVAVWVAQPVAVPEVRRRPLPDAMRTLRDAKLRPSPDATGGDRDVSAQAPAPGSVVNAGSVVRLTTVPMATVPEVATQPLNEAIAALSGARFVPRADASDDATNRRVSSQQPTGGTRARQGSVVELATKRFASVPPLAGKTCDEARVEARRHGLGLACDAEDSWRTRVFGTPRIDARQPPPTGRAEVGTELRASARAPLPSSLQWLEHVPLPAAVAGVCTPLLAFALLLFRRWPPGRTARLPAGLPSAPPPLRASLHWRAEPDASPSVTLRAPALDAEPRGALPLMAWHVVPDEARVTLREAHPQAEPDPDPNPVSETGALHEHR